MVCGLENLLKDLKKFKKETAKKNFFMKLSGTNFLLVLILKLPTLKINKRLTLT